MSKRERERLASHLAVVKDGVEGGKARGDQEWERVLARMPVGWEERGRASGVLKRRRGVQSVEQMLRLTLGLGILGWSLRLTAGWAEVVEIAQLSDVALRKRVRKTRAWLGGEIGRLLQVRRERWAGRSVRARLADATTVSQPGSRGTDWRVHAVINLEQGALDGIEITDKHGAESLVRHPFEPGEIAVADRIHARRTDFGVLLAASSDLVVRIGWQNLPLETPACPEESGAGQEGGERIDLIAWLDTLGASPTERPVQVQTPTGIYPLRLIAAPLPPDKAEAARRRCRQAAAKKQRTVDRRTLVAAGFILLVTTLDPTIWSTADVLALYRLRWQIELVFKRLKGLWHLDHLRAHDPECAQVFILSVLLAALLAADLGAAAPLPPDAALDTWLDDQHHPLSRWRWDALWRDAFLAAIRGPFDLASLLAHLPTLRRYLCDPPRKRRHQATDARLFLRAHPPRQEERSA